MPDLTDFHPLMQDAMRTGRMPSHAEIAHATGRTTDEVSRMLRETATQEETYDTEPVADPPDPDEQKYRDKYRKLVDAMITDWYEDNPAAVSIPTDYRERIEDHCRRQIQRE